MGVLLAIGSLVGVILAAELGRTLVAMLFGYPPNRVPFVKLMILPGIRGTTGFRLALILTGPITAYLAIVGLAFGFYTCHGFGGPVNTVAAIEGAATGQLVTGDVILEVDGKPFAGGSVPLSQQVNDKGGTPVVLTIERDGTRSPVTITPTLAEQHGKPRWLLGVRLEARVETDRPRAIKSAFAFPVEQALNVGRGLVAIGKDSGDVDPGGPVRIVAEFKAAADDSAPAALGLAMMLAVYVLLGLLVVDVGRIVFLLLFRS